MTPPDSPDWDSTAFHGAAPFEPPVAITARLRLAASIAERRGGWTSYPVLWVLDDFEADPREIRLHPEGVNVGRELGIPFLLGASGLSRNHFRIWQDGSDWKVEDLASRNGTALNGKPIKSGERLRDGDWIEAGHLLFVPNLPDESLVDLPGSPAAD